MLLDGVRLFVFSKIVVAIQNACIWRTSHTRSCVFIAPHYLCPLILSERFGRFLKITVAKQDNVACNFCDFASIRKEMVPQTVKTLAFQCAKVVKSLFDPFIQIADFAFL